MSGLVAVFNRNGEPVVPGVLEAMLAASPHRAIHGEDILVSGTAALAHQHFWVTPEEQGERQPLASEDGLAITFDGRLDNRQYLLRLLCPHYGDPIRLSDADLVILAYQRWGEVCPEHLLGDFAFVLWDVQKHRLFLARDALGGRELHCFIDDHRFVAASEIVQVLAHPAVPRRLNEGRVAEYLAGLWLGNQETFYAGIWACPPGHAITVTIGNIEKRQYWALDPEARLRLNDDLEYAACFRELLADSVSCRLRTSGPVAVSLSGGLDSTSIAVVAASMFPGSPARQQQLKSISYIFDELLSCDERAYIESVVRQANLDPTYLVCDHCWTLRDIDRWPASPNTVTGDAFAWLPLAVLQEGQNAGCRLLLNGHFGDTLFAGGRYWAADLFRQMRLTSIVTGMLEIKGSSRWKRDLWSNGLAQLAPTGVFEGYYRTRLRWKAPASISQSFAARSGLEERWRRQTRPHRGIAHDRSSRWHGLAENAWPQAIALAREFAHQHQVELVMPWWDRRLVEFAMAVPAYQLGRFGQTRWVQRTAMVGLLPESVRRRSGKTSFQSLFEKGLLERERTTVSRLLVNPQIVQRGFIDPAWLNARKETMKEDGEVSYPFWLALSLELWLQRYWT